FGMFPGYSAWNGYGNMAGPYYSNLYAGLYYNAAANSMLGAYGGSAGQPAYGPVPAQSDILREQAKQERVQTRKSQFEQWMAEQAAQPTPDQLRLRQQQQDLRRSLGQPPLTEIATGKPLNDLLAPLVEMLDRDAGVKAVPLNRG